MMQIPSNLLFNSSNPIRGIQKLEPSNQSPLIPNAQVLNYIRKKCNLSIEQIYKKLLHGDIFDIIGQGTDVDTRLMEEVLKQNDFYQKPSQKLIRQQTMKFVKRVIDEWSTQIAKNQMRISLDQISNYTAKLLPFGSYVLDLKSNTSDIDLICVCPIFIKRDTHFFQHLFNRFQSDPQVKSLSKVINARVPIISFQYKQTDIDISFCQLNQETVPRDIQKVITNELVQSITDDRSKTSLLGRKNNLMILQLTGGQVENFKQTLRVVKVWAKNRGISSNGMGYLGGISWAILMAKICQIFPHHKPIKLLQQFFLIYSIWNWKSMPINIMAPGDQKFDKYLMCVVTPGSAYNSTQRVNEITYKVLQQELKRANELMMLRRPLSEICKKSDFINNFPLFIQIDICGKNRNKQQQKQYKQFKGNVQSKILKLLSNIIRFHKKHIEELKLRIVPNPNIYKKKQFIYYNFIFLSRDQTYELCNSIFMGINVDPQTEIDLGRPVVEWSNLINQARGERKQFLNLRIFQCKKEDFNDVQIMEQPKKKKQEKMDPRLALRMQRQNS